jgi:hypothetical protein
MNFRLLLLCLFLIHFTACDKQSTFDNLVDNDVNNYNKQIIAELIKGDSSVINRFIVGGADSVEAYALFDAAKIFRTYSLQSSKIIGLSKGVSTSKGRTEQVNYEYKFDNSLYAYFFVQVSKKDNGYSIKGFRIQLNTESLSERAAFTFKGKGFFHYLCFALAILIPAFIIYTIIIVVKTSVRRKWLWITLVIIFNFPFYFNWYTGKLRFEQFKFQILGLGIEQGSIDEPWTFALAIPLGAIIFWVKRQSIIKKQREYEELVAMYPQNQQFEENNPQA